MSKQRKILYKSYGIDKVDKNIKNQEELYNLYKPIIKDKGVNMPHFYNEMPNHTHQSDLLFLPNDHGFKYLLVVVDIATRLTDTEPLKMKSSIKVRDAFIKIYSKKILKLPKLIILDSGTEYKGLIKNYFIKNKVGIKYAKKGRHRQLAIVERKNQDIGKALHIRMSGQELITNEPSKQWVKDLPNIIKALNKKVKNKNIKKPPEYPVCQGASCNILDKNTKVRVQLDEPIDITTSKKLIGKFRSSDIKWDPKIRKIKDIIIRPGQPILYQVSGIKNVSYTYNQLQVVPKNEKAPIGKLIIRGIPKTYIIEKIIGHKIIKGKKYFKVKWKGFTLKDATWEPKKNLPEKLIDKYEKYLKK